MKILFYIAVDSTHPGGVQTATVSLARDLSARGHKVTSFWSEATGTPVPDRTIMRLHLRSVGREKMPRRLVHFPSLWRVFKALLRTRPDIVHVHYITHRTYYFLLFRKLFGYKLVLTAHGSDLLRPWNRELPFLKRFLCSSDGLTAVSDDLAGGIEKSTGEPSREVIVIPNSVDTDYYVPRKLDRDRSDRTLNVVAVGRLHPVKGHDVLIRALAVLIERGFDLRVSLIGDGEELENLQRMAEDLDVAPYVHFMGNLSKQDVRLALQRSDVFVLPSRSEGLPLALIEAMACGLPCVGSAVGGVPQALEGAGDLVSPDSPGELAKALERLARDKEYRIRRSEDARRRALNFSSNAAVVDLENYYQEVLCAN